MNEKQGDDHGVNLDKLRTLAKRLTTQQELACQLREKEDTATRLLAILVCRPKSFERNRLAVLVRESRTPRVHDWFVSHMARMHSHAEECAWPGPPIRIHSWRVPAGW